MMASDREAAADPEVLQPQLYNAAVEDEAAEEKARKAAQKAKRKSRGPHEVSEELNIVALMDAFTIILVFLIKSYSSDPNNITQSQDLTVPQSHTQLNITEAVPLVITTKAILVANKAVARMTEHGIDPTDIRGHDIPAIVEALKKQAEDQKRIASRNSKVNFEGKLLIVADRKTPFSTLTDVLYNAGQAEFGQYKFAVLKTE